MLEVEVKIKTDIDIISKKLLSLGFKKAKEIYEKDTYFNGKYIDLKKEDKALRIREYREKGNELGHFILNYKGPKIDNSTMTREETEFEIPSYEDGESVLNGLGLFPAGYVEKIRNTYVKEDITCCLDRVTELGEFVEVEIITHEAGYESALSRIEGLLKMLGLDMQDTIRESYLCMLQK